MEIKIKSLPKPPAYSTLSKDLPIQGQKKQDHTTKRDWSKVNRGTNKGTYGRPVFWNEDRLRVLKQLRDQGKSYREIAEEFGKTPEACRRQWDKACGY